MTNERTVRYGRPEAGAQTEQDLAQCCGPDSGVSELGPVEFADVELYTLECAGLLSRDDHKDDHEDHGHRDRDVRDMGEYIFPKCDTEKSDQPEDDQRNRKRWLNWAGA